MDMNLRELKAKIEQTKRLTSLLLDARTKTLFEGLLKELEQKQVDQKKREALVYW
jgi:hypothetical protein